MKTEQRANYVEITADEGMVLTSANDGERNFVHVVCTTHPELWEEWTDEQMEQWQAEHPQEEEPIEEEIEPLSQDEL